LRSKFKRVFPTQIRNNEKRKPAIISILNAYYTRSTSINRRGKTEKIYVYVHKNQQREREREEREGKVNVC
jgi:hypothetical protein